jgi:hypothetical protein
MTYRAATLTGAVLTFIALTSSLARAEPTKAQCITANTKAQSLRREGKLTEARQQLRMCGDPKCPALVSTDCAKRLDELESVQPTLVIDVKDAGGRDLSEVRVTVDGQPLLDRLDGSATPVDLGAHHFTFSVAGAAPVSEQLVIREGEKSRPLHVVLEGVGTKPAAAKAAPPARVTPSGDNANAEAAASTVNEAPPRPQRTAGYVVTGIGAAGLAVGGVFGYLALSAKNRQTDNCSPSACPDRQTAATAHDSAKTNGTISTIAFAAGAAVATVGIVLIATAKPAQEEPASSMLTLGAHAGPGTGELCLSGLF